MSKISSRWQEYFMRKGNEVRSFWVEHLSAKRDLLFIIGLGFDPRMFLGLDTILEIGGDGKRDCMLIKFDEGPNSASKRYFQTLVKREEELDRKLKGGNKIIRTIQMVIEDSNRSRRIGSRRAPDLLEINQILGYDDILMDVSSLPRGIFFPMIGKLLHLLDGDRKSVV